MNKRNLILLLLAVVTAFQVAWWTELYNASGHSLFAALMYTARVLLLGAWTLVGLLFWKEFIGECSRSVGFAFCLSGAILAELLQHSLHPQTPDGFGLLCNLAGVLAGACLYERFVGPHRAFAVIDPRS